MISARKLENQGAKGEEISGELVGLRLDRET